MRDERSCQWVGSPEARSSYENTLDEPREYCMYVLYIGGGDVQSSDRDDDVGCTVSLGDPRSGYGTVLVLVLVLHVRHRRKSVRRQIQ